MTSEGPFQPKACRDSMICVVLYLLRNSLRRSCPRAFMAGGFGSQPGLLWCWCTRWQQRVAAPTPAEPPSGARVCPGYGNGNLGTARVQQQRGKSVSQRVTMTVHGDGNSCEVTGLHGGWVTLGLAPQLLCCSMGSLWDVICRCGLGAWSLESPEKW